jgi:hypothetical protein
MISIYDHLKYMPSDFLVDYFEIAVTVNSEKNQYLYFEEEPNPNLIVNSYESLQYCYKIYKMHYLLIESNN